MRRIGTPQVGPCTFVLFDPMNGPRARRFADLDAAQRVEPRYRGYSEAAAALRRAAGDERQ